MEGTSYRLQRIIEIQNQLKVEKDRRSKLTRNYKSIVKIINITDNVLSVLAMGLSIAGVGVLSTIVAIPIALATEAVTVATIILFTVGNQFQKRLELKVKKHKEIMILAEEKLNEISKHVSTAFNDDEVISDEEFALVVSQLDDFLRKKEIARTKSNVKILKRIRKVFSVKK